MKLRPRALVLAVSLVIAGYLWFEHESQSRIVGGLDLDVVEHLVDTSPIVDNDHFEISASMAGKRTYAAEAECSDTGTNEQTACLGVRGTSHSVEAGDKFIFSLERGTGVHITIQSGVTSSIEQREL